MQNAVLGRKKIEFISTQDEINKHQKEVEDYEMTKLMQRLSSAETNAPKKPLDRIVVVGCGGTGSWLIPKLAKTINDMKRKKLLANHFSLILVDGDQIEPKNLIRQNFVESDIGKNKAEIMALRYGATLKDINVQYIDKYLTDKSSFDTNHFSHINVLQNMIYDDNYCVIFNLVDNQNARRAVHSLQFCGWIVDIGNELAHGQLFATPYGLTSGIIGSLSFFTMSPETLTADEEVKIYSCAEADADTELEEQFLVANDTAALVGHNWLCSLMSGPDVVPARINFTCLPIPTVETVLKTIRF